MHTIHNSVAWMQGNRIQGSDMKQFIIQLLTGLFMRWIMLGNLRLI